jgi:hypothetical protein
MSIQHISRTGKTYFLTIVPGKTGNPVGAWLCSRRNDNLLVPVLRLATNGS